MVLVVRVFLRDWLCNAAHLLPTMVTQDHYLLASVKRFIFDPKKQMYQ